MQEGALDADLRSISCCRMWLTMRLRHRRREEARSGEFDHARPRHQQTFVHARRRPRTGRRRAQRATTAISPQIAYAQASGDSLLRTVLDRGHLIVGTGSTNAPWHFEDDQGNLVGMDIAMAQILAQGLFDDPTKIQYVRQEADARIPNVTTGKVDITIQFMTVTSGRAQLVNFTRPYYVEGIALLTKPGSAKEKFDALLAGGAGTKVSILQNVDAEQSVHEVLPQAEVLQIDSQANVIQALEAGRADAAAVDLSTVWWMVKRTPDKYADSGRSGSACCIPPRCGRAIPTGSSSSTPPGTWPCSATTTLSRQGVLGLFRIAATGA
jgi:polar amino acid transport system substrate-binding protein